MCYAHNNIHSMAETSRKILKIKENLPSSNLKQEDTKFVAELVAYIASINGRNKLQISIHDSFTTRYKVIVAQMPELQQWISIFSMRAKFLALLNFSKNESIMSLDLFNRSGCPT